MSKEITSREQDYSQWYNDLVIKGGLADYSAVRGCMVIKPYGYGLWENMRDVPIFPSLFPKACLRQRRRMPRVSPRSVPW